MKPLTNRKRPMRARLLGLALLVSACAGGSGTPTTLASGQFLPNSLAQDEANLYWKSLDELFVIDKEKSANAVVACAETNAEAISSAFLTLHAAALPASTDLVAQPDDAAPSPSAPERGGAEGLGS